MRRGSYVVSYTNNAFNKNTSRTHIYFKLNLFYRETFCRHSFLLRTLVFCMFFETILSTA